MPSEIIFNIPLISIYGDKQIVIENFKNVVQYSNNVIRLNSNIGVIKITGKNLLLKELTKTKIIVNGVVNCLQFV